MLKDLNPAAVDQFSNGACLKQAWNEHIRPKPNAVYNEWNKAGDYDLSFQAAPEKLTDLTADCKKTGGTVNPVKTQLCALSFICCCNGERFPCHICNPDSS